MSRNPPQRVDEWWRGRLKLIEDVAAPASNVDAGINYQKDGFWPAIKLIITQYALGFYPPIMRPQVRRGGWDSLHFIDTNAGNGLNLLRSRNVRNCEALVAGTALIGANTALFEARNMHFDHYHFIEPISGFAQTLERRLERFLPRERFTVYPKAAGEAVAEIIKRLENEWTNPHYFSIVDPEGLTEVTLPDLKPLLEFGRGDLLFNFQYMACKRTPPAARRFFGDDGWDESMSEDEVRAHFRRLLVELGRPVTESFEVAAGQGSGRYAYDFVYCAVQTQAGTPWLRKMRESLDPRIRGISGHNVDRMLCGGQSTLV